MRRINRIDEYSKKDNVIRWVNNNDEENICEDKKAGYDIK